LVLRGSKDASRESCFKTRLTTCRKKQRLQRIASLRATVEVAEIVARRVIVVSRRMPDIIIEGSALLHRDALEAAALWIARLPIYELPGALVAREVQNIAPYANRMHKVLDQISTQGYQSDESQKSLRVLNGAPEKALVSLTSFANEYSRVVEVIRAVDL